MHWRQSGPPGVDASVARASQPTNSVGSILGVSKRTDGSAGEVWGWGDVISFRIPETIRCAERSRNTGGRPVFSVEARETLSSVIYYRR